MGIPAVDKYRHPDKPAGSCEKHQDPGGNHCPAPASCPSTAVARDQLPLRTSFADVTLVLVLANRRKVNFRDEVFDAAPRRERSQPLPQGEQATRADRNSDRSLPEQRRRTRPEERR